MAIEVKKPKKDECLCGHPLGKEAARKKHEEEREKNEKAFRERQIAELHLRLNSKIYDIERLEHKSHRHWWQ